MKDNPPSRESIAERAYSLWEQAGRPAGRDEDFWLRAKAELTGPANGSGVPPIIPPPLTVPPPIATTMPLHQVPPPIKDAVNVPSRRPPRLRVPKRA